MKDFKSVTGHIEKGPRIEYQRAKGEMGFKKWKWKLGQKTLTQRNLWMETKVVFLRVSRQRNRQFQRLSPVTKMERMKWQSTLGQNRNRRTERKTEEADTKEGYNGAKKEEKTN